MNERILELARQVWPDPSTSHVNHEKFAKLIILECSNILFDESERLFAYSAECDNMRESDEAELIAEKCVDFISMIEQRFGVEE
jgi:hypothetical protein